VDEWRGACAGELMSEERHAQLRGWFLEVVAGMTHEQKAKLFAFTCGSSRLAGDGFKSLRLGLGLGLGLGCGLAPTLTLTLALTLTLTRPFFRVEVRGEPEQLPTSHTCFNELDLPPYASKAVLASKLHIAIESGAGFGFV